mgnify:CR=1 FL=1
MFDFFVDLFGEIKKDAFRYQVDCGKKIVVQGYKSVLVSNEEKIVLKLENGELNIIGNNLKIVEFGTNTFVATGTIKSVETAGGGSEK